jgi:hypothetical protein
MVLGKLVQANSGNNMIIVLFIIFSSTLTWASSLIHKYKTSLKVSEKHNSTSLLHTGIIYYGKEFPSTGLKWQ